MDYLLSLSRNSIVVTVVGGIHVLLTVHYDNLNLELNYDAYWLKNEVVLISIDASKFVPGGFSDSVRLRFTLSRQPAQHSDTTLTHGRDTIHIPGIFKLLFSHKIK